MCNNKSGSTEHPKLSLSNKKKIQNKKYVGDKSSFSFLPLQICLVLGCAAVSHTCVAESGGG